jgi:transcriptional regulator with XRE-family HTH domain
MGSREKACADFIKAMIEKSPMPRNQIAALSGLTNTYIRDLESGKYESVRREKLIALSIAVNLDLNETDELLMLFDRMPLSTADLPTFLLMAAKRKSSAALMPLRDLLPLELTLLSAERRPGHEIVVNIQPTYCLSSKDQRRYTERFEAADHALFGDLVEAITTERNRLLDQNLVNYRFDQYICFDCLKHYLRTAEDDQDRQWRIQHLHNVIQYVEKYENFHFFIIQTCPTASFTLKLAPDSSRDTDNLFLVLWPRHDVWKKRTGRLTGFTTDNPVIIQNFKEEIESLKGYVLEECHDRKRLVAFLHDLI